MIKAVLLDFDGTLVTRDILDVVCGLADKETESAQLNRDFHNGKSQGLTTLITRINFLQGITVDQIKTKLNQNSYFVPGVQDLFRYLHEKKIVTILNSGNILPILQYYQNLLGIDYVVGTTPQMNGNSIKGIAVADFPDKDFKVAGVKKILERLHIPPQETIAVGDSPADKAMFGFAGSSVAINPKSGIDLIATYKIDGDISQVIPIIEALNI